ncbi:FAD-dependent oxidoreductase [Amycolatopsis sp. NPDC058986]|uniref:FAD-dependent oxidoreductase n=1 Tax=unclassified Amycolatopsis TaxID=2618356 RepID=UPI00366D046D
MKVVICGAGIAGLACANRLAALGAEVVVLEKAAGPRAQGYMIDFFGPGYDAAEEMGVLPAIQARAYYVEEAAFVDGSGRRRAGLRLTQFAGPLAGRLLSVMRPDLECALRDALPAGVELRFGTSLTGIDTTRDGVRCTLDGGEVVEADLLVGADGVHSAVRRLWFGPEPEFLRHLGFHTAAFRFRDPEIHAAVGDRFCLTETVGAQMGFYGLRDGEVAAFAVHRTWDAALPVDARAALRAGYGSLGWVVPGALDRCPPPAEVYYDQVAQIVLPRWSRDRVVLLGDAAYAVSLLAGQGASLAIAGAFVLADRLARASSVEAGLAGYERMWRPVVERTQRDARSTARWFVPASRLSLHVRRLAMRASRLPGLDRLVTAAVAGKPTELINRLRDSGSPGRWTTSPGIDGRTHP